VKYSSLFLTLMLALSLPAGARPGWAAAATGAAAKMPRREKAIAVDVRGAPLADVLSRASEATGVKMGAAGAVGDQRVTLHAGRTTAGELQQALRDLLRLRVSEAGTETSARYSFREDTHFAAQQEAGRLRQANAFLDALFRTAGGFAAGQEAATVRSVRQRFRTEHPEFSDAMLAPVTADYLRQSLLITALPAALRSQLARSGWISLPVPWLSPAAQTLLAAFAQSGAGWTALDEGVLQSGPVTARVQYRLFYGDRWTGPMLLAQVGAPGAWTSAMLPSVLFRQQDDSSLYPEAAVRPDDPDVWRRLPPHFHMAGKDWDTVLDELAKSMEIKLAADSYARPWLFNTDRPLPEIAGIPLRDALDRLCQEHGYFWWKQDGWYLLRSRNWTEESRVAVPDRLLRGWVASAQARGALTASDLFQLATLSDEQLLTLNLESQPAGGVEFLGSGFDPNEADLIANGLLLFHGLPPVQQQMALTDGLPALWLPAAQQNLFAAVAAQYGVELLPENADTWSFRIRQAFSGEQEEGATAVFGPKRAGTPALPGSEREGSTHPVSGDVSVEWHLGPGADERASVTISDRALHRMEEPANPSNVR
jgi:hypothetical protein